MFEGVLEKLLLKLFGEYVQEFNRDQLKVSIWAGDVVLTDLQLKVGALDSFRLPLEVIHGQISTLTIQIPWTRIASAPVHITIDGLYVLCGPQRARPNAGSTPTPDDEAHNSVNAAADMAWTLKQRLLEQHEAAKRAADEEKEDGSAGGSTQSYSARIISKIISNLQLTVKHVHVRYEDATTLRGASSTQVTTTASSTSLVPSSPSSSQSRIPSAAFACGFTIGEIVAHTTDSQGNVRFMSGEGEHGSVTYKLVELRSGAVYWNSEIQELWQDLDGPARIRKMKQMNMITTNTVASSPSSLSPSYISSNLYGYDYILHPLDITMRAILHHGDNDTELLKIQEAEYTLARSTHAPLSIAPPPPSSSAALSSLSPPTSKYYLSFTLPHLSLQLRSSQYRDCVKILDHFSQLKVSQTIAARMAKLPRFPVKDRSSIASGMNGVEKRKRTMSSASSTSSRGGSPNRIQKNDSNTTPNTRTPSETTEMTSDDEDDEDDESEDEFCTPKQSPLATPLSPSSPHADDGFDLSAAPSATPPSTTSSLRIHRPAWCRPYWRHAIKCLILLKSRRARLDWLAVKEYATDRKRYIQLWMRQVASVQLRDESERKARKYLNPSWFEPLSSEEKQQLLDYERKLNYESIVVFRRLAESQWKVTQQMAETLHAQKQHSSHSSASPMQRPAASPTTPSLTALASPNPATPSASSSTTPAAKKGSWWSMLGFKQNTLSPQDFSDSLDAEATKLLASITLTPEQQRKIWEQEQSLPLFFKKLQVEVNLIDADFRLTQAVLVRRGSIGERSNSDQPEYIQKEITRIVWDGHLSLIQRLKNWSACVSVTKLEVIDSATEKTCFEKVLSSGGASGQRSRTNSGADGGKITSPPLLSIQLDDSPRLLESTTCADFRVSLQLQPIAVVISPLYLDTILRFFREKDTTAYLWAAASNWEKHARSELLTALTDHREMEIDISIIQPSILLPIDCLKATSTVLVSDLELLRMCSRPSIKAASKKTNSNAGADTPHHPSSIQHDISTLTHVSPTNPQAYDSFHLQFQACRLYTCASVQDWQENSRNYVVGKENTANVEVEEDRDESSSSKDSTSSPTSSMLYIVDGEVDTSSDDRMPQMSPTPSASMPSSSPLSLVSSSSFGTSSSLSASPSFSRSTSIASSSMHHTHRGFDVSLIMYTCIDRFEKVRMKNAREKERQRQKLMQDMILSGQAAQISSLPLIEPSYPLSKILIQGSLPRLNISVCASTLEVIRTLKEQLVPMWMNQNSSSSNSAAASSSNTANPTSTVKTGSSSSSDAQTMLQLANETNVRGNDQQQQQQQRKSSHPGSSSGPASSTLITIRNTLECGFIVDQLSVNILRDRVARNARAAAAALHHTGKSNLTLPPFHTYLNPNAAPIFLLHITRMGGNFVTNTQREIMSSFQLTSICILDCLQKEGRKSKFAYLACSYPPPEYEGSREIYEQQQTKKSASEATTAINTRNHSMVDSTSSAASSAIPSAVETAEEQLQFSFSHALSRAVQPAAKQPTAQQQSQHSRSSPASPVDVSSHLIRIRYKFLFHPQRNEHEWETEEGGESEEAFLKGVENKSSSSASSSLPYSSTTSRPHTTSSSSSSDSSDAHIGVSSFIDFDFNTLYVNWNPNTIAAVLAYLRYDENVQNEKETQAISSAQQKEAAAGASTEASANQKAAPSSPIVTSSNTTARLPVSTPTPSSTVNVLDVATPAASSNKKLSSSSSNASSKKKVRVRAPSSVATSIISPIASTWSSAHKNITILTARLRKLSITFNKETESRSLWRLEMVHSTVEHRHIIHPSPFLFYLMTTNGTGHRSKKESARENRGFISEASREGQQRKVSQQPSSPKNMNASTTTNTAIASSSSTSSSTTSSHHLSRDAIHTFVTKGSLGNVHIYDLDSDKRLKYREMLGLRGDEKGNVKPQAQSRQTSGLYVDIGSPHGVAPLSPPPFTPSATSPSTSSSSTVSSVLDFQFASNQLEVSQRREWYIRRRKEIAWMNEHAGEGSEKIRDWKDATDAILAESSIPPAMTTPLRQASNASTANTPGGGVASSSSSTSSTNKLPSMPTFADTHLMVHVNSLRVVYLQQPTMELIDYFNEGILGAFQAQLRPKKVDAATLAAQQQQLLNQPDRYNKMSITLSNPQVVLPRNAYSPTHILIGLRSIKVLNTITPDHRLILGIDVQGGTVYSSELTPDGGFQYESVYTRHPGSSSQVRTPMLELACYVTSSLPQPDHLRQPHNQDYFDSITTVDASRLRGYMSWKEYVLLLNIFNENIRAPPPVRARVKKEEVLEQVVPGQPRVNNATAPSSAAAAAVPPVMLPISSTSFTPTPSLTDAPTVIYHVNDERPPLTLDIKIHIASAQVKFLLGDGYVVASSSDTHNKKIREDGLSEIIIQDTTYIFQTFSSRHMHSSARVHSVTMMDLRESSKNIPFKLMLCPFEQIKEMRKKKTAQPMFQMFGVNNQQQTSSAPSTPNLNIPTAKRQISMNVGPTLSAASSSSLSPAPATSAPSASLPAPSSAAEVEYIQHDYPSGERDMQLRIFKPCGFVIPDFWMDFITGFLFTANDSAYADQQKMMDEWTRKQLEVNGEMSASTSKAASPTSPSQSPGGSKDPNRGASSPLSTTTGACPAGYIPSPFTGAKRPFRCFKLHLKNSRFILLEDLTSLHCRALVSTCDATMTYTSEEMQNMSAPLNLPRGQPGEWWTAWEWARHITVTKLRIFVCSSASNPVINAAHSVVTPLNVVLKQTFKTEKRYYEPRNTQYYVREDSTNSQSSSSAMPPLHSTPSRLNNSSTAFTVAHTTSPIFHSPLRLEIHDQMFVDIHLSSASGLLEEPIELRASYQDFHLITNCMETLQDQQKLKDEEQARAKEMQQEAAKQAREQAKMQRAASNSSLHALYSSTSASGGGFDLSHMPARSSTPLLDYDDDIDSQVSDNNPLPSPSSSMSSSTHLNDTGLDTFQESVQMLNVIWRNQLTFVIINDCSQRYVPLLHARVLAGDALCVAKRKELDDEEKEDEDEEEMMDQQSSVMDEEKSVSGDGSSTTTAASPSSSTAAPPSTEDGPAGKSLQTALDRAKSFLQKLKHGGNDSSTTAVPSTPERVRRSRLVKNVVDFKTVAVTLLLEVTYFNPRVVVWEPLIEPMQLSLKCQYETPNIKNQSHSQHHSSSFGKVGMAGAGQQAKRRMRGAVVVHNNQTSSGTVTNNIPAWTINLTCTSRVNVNISYVFLQHLYTTLQTWNADFQSQYQQQQQNQQNQANAHSASTVGGLTHDPNTTPTGPSTGTNNANSSSSSSYQAFSPYFIRNLTGGEVLYRCRNIIRESTTQQARSNTYNSSVASAASQAYALHDRIEMHSEFAERPDAFITPVGPVIKKRVSSYASSMSSLSTASVPEDQSMSFDAEDAYQQQQQHQLEEEAESTTHAPQDDPDDGLEAVHSLAPGAEEQLSLRLITGTRQKRPSRWPSASTPRGGASSQQQPDDEADSSAEDDVYRSILASRAPFSLRVRLAGGWVALNDLVVNKVGTTSYVLQLDTMVANTFNLTPLSALSTASTTTSMHTTPSRLSSHSPNASSLIHDYFPASNAPTNNGAASSNSPASMRSGPPPSLGMIFAGGAAGVASGAAGVASGAAGAVAGVGGGGSGIKSPLPPPIYIPSPSPTSTSASAAASVPGAMPSSATAPALTMVQVSDRKQLLFVDVVLRDGSKVVTLRSPIELVNRTNRPLCFLLHAHPTTARRHHISINSHTTPYPDWMQSNSAFLQTKDAYAILGPVAAGATINVPFSLTHLDYVSAVPVSQRAVETQRRFREKARQAAAAGGSVNTATSPAAAHSVSSMSTMLSGAATLLDGHASSSGSSSDTSDDEDNFQWSDTALSQSTLMKQVHEQAAKYTASHSSSQPPGVVTKLQCHKSGTVEGVASSGTSSNRWRSDSSFLLHVQAVHGSGGAPSHTVGVTSTTGAGIGENLLTLSLVFTPPYVIRNLFPYGIDFRVAYTRANPATALMNFNHHAGHSSQNVLSVSSAVQQNLSALGTTKRSEAELKAESKAEKEKRAQQEKETKILEKLEAKNPSGSTMPGRLDQSHPHTNGKARYEVWGHIASGQHIYMEHLNHERDPYLMFRLDGFGWSERIPMCHLNPEVQDDDGVTSSFFGGSSSASDISGGSSQQTQQQQGADGPRSGLDYTISSYLMKQHVARHSVTIEDNNGNPLIAQLESRRAGPQGGGLELDLYVQYWLINRTGLDLLYGSRMQVTESEGARSVIRTLPGHGGRVELFTYENQRYSVLDGWIAPFLPTDRPSWSDEEGNDRPKEWFRLPADDGSWRFEGEWHIDYGQPPDTNNGFGDDTTNNNTKKDSDAEGYRQTDGNGWEYSVDFPWSFHPRNNTLDAVRRRRWVRSYVSTRSLKPLCLHSTNIRGFKEELCVRVSPLTRGGEYHREMHTKSGASAPLVRVRNSDSPWSLPFSASGNNDGLLLIQETQNIDIANDVDLEHAKWRRAAAHVMAAADAGAEKGKFQLQGSDDELGSLAPHVIPRAQYQRQNRYDIGVAFQHCPGLFHRTQMISFTPRFLLVNRLPYTLFFRQAGAHHRGRIAVLNIESGKFQPFWWQDIGVQQLGAEQDIKGQPGAPPVNDPGRSPTPGQPAQQDNNKSKLPPVSSAEFEARKQHARRQNTEFEALASIAFASSSSVRWRWTGAFPIDEVGELSIACRSSAMTSRFLRVKIVLEGATVFVIFQEEDLSKPRYRLDNCTNCPMWYRQKLPYVNESWDQVLTNLPVPAPTHQEPPPMKKAMPPSEPMMDGTRNPAASPIPPSPSPIPPMQSPSASPTALFSPSANVAALSQPLPTGPPQQHQRQIISSDSLSPWLYLGPGESTPFAWQEILVQKPYLLEVITSTPYVAQHDQPTPGEGGSSLAASRAASTIRYSPTTLTSTQSVSSLFSRASRDQSTQLAQQKAAERAQRAHFDAKVRARIGQYTCHMCDTVQLDEIGYSLISMEAQTFIDVYVEDEASYDKKGKQRKRSVPNAHASSSRNSSGGGGGATKVMKLVRKQGVRELGVAEAAAVLQQQEHHRARAMSGDRNNSASSSDNPNSAPRAQHEIDATAPSKSNRDATSFDPSTNNDYVPVHRRELQVEKTSLFFEFLMPKFSFSLVDHLPRELALCSLRDLKITYSKSNIYQKCEVLLGDMQIDNQMADAMFPVVLHQKQDVKRVVGHSSNSSSSSPRSNSDSNSIIAPRPFLHLSIIRLTKYSSLEHYKYVGFLAQEFVLKLDQSFILACIPFLDVFYNARFKVDDGASGSKVECSSMEDLERELGIPLASEDEYSEGVTGEETAAESAAAGTLSPATSSASGIAPTLVELENEFHSQISALSHHKAVLATLQSKLSLETNTKKGQPQSSVGEISIRTLQDDIARTTQQYQRLLEANQAKAMQIQKFQPTRPLPKVIIPGGAGGSSASPSSSSSSSYSLPAPATSHYRASHVSSIASSWIEGSDQKHSEFRTRHGNPTSKLGVPYRGWVGPMMHHQHHTHHQQQHVQSGNAAAATATASVDGVTLHAISPTDDIDLLHSFPHHSDWISANSNQNQNVSRTLTALVNATLAKAQSRHAARQKNRRKNAKHHSHHDSKHTEESEMDQIYYLENVEINSVQCIFSFFTLPSYTTMRSSSSSSVLSSRSHNAGGTSSSVDVVPTWFVTLGFGSHDSNPELLSSQTQALANAISSKTLMIANAEDAHLKLTGLHITHSFTTIQDMMSLLTQHYTKQLQLQLFELVGASHVLGNPIGLISNLGTGVFDLVNEPISGAIKGPAAFGVGVAVGVGSFVKYSVRGVASTASSLLGTMGNASATLTADPEYLRKRKLGRIRQPKHLASGLLDGGRHLAKGLFDGVTGIFTSPVDGALNEGASGFFKGVGRGLIGVVVKPVTGVFDAVTTVTEGIKNTTSLFDKRVIPQRPPRIMYGPDQLMRVFSDKELSASCFLDTRGNLRLNGHQRETYQDHLTLQMIPSKLCLKENDARLKAMKDDAAAGHESESLPPSGASSASNSPRSSTSSMRRTGTDADMRGGLDDPHSRPGRLVTHSSSLANLHAQPSSASLLSTTTSGAEPWHISFVLTDHSLVCLKLDMKGNMNASLSHSSSSSARATTFTPSGGNVSSLLSSSSSSGTTHVSKYARILYSFLWIQVQSIEVIRTNPSGVFHLVLRVLISPKQANDIRKSERIKSIFTLAYENVSQGLPHSALAAFSSSTSYFSSNRASNAHAPLLLRMAIPCGSQDDATRLESMMRLAQVRAQAESGRRNTEQQPHPTADPSTAASSSHQLVHTSRAQVMQQIAHASGTALPLPHQIAPTPLLRVAATRLNQPPNNS